MAENSTGGAQPNQPQFQLLVPPQSPLPNLHWLQPDSQCQAKHQPWLQLLLLLQSQLSQPL